jgi:hypothetical protein
MLALYLTIWLALILFVAGETGRAMARGGQAPGWAWWTFTLGLVLALVHTAIAFDVVHDWVHADAVLATARQTEEVFGVGVGWGVYVNYAFYAVWLADAVWWRRSPNLWQRPANFTRMLRSFYLVIIINAAIIFAAGPRRILGILIVSWLVRMWALSSRRASASPLPR